VLFQEVRSLSELCVRICELTLNPVLHFDGLVYEKIQAVIVAKSFCYFFANVFGFAKFNACIAALSRLNHKTKQRNNVAHSAVVIILVALF